MWTVVLLTLIDAFGFAPTFCKSFYKPWDEQLGFYAWMSMRNVVAIAALGHYSLTTVIFSALTGVLGQL